MSYQFASAERARYGHDHDRTAIVRGNTMDSFAVLDGSAGPKGSDRGVKIFRRHSSRNLPPDLETTFRAMHRGVARQRPLVKGRAVMRHVAHHEEIGRTPVQAFQQAQKWLVGLTTCAAIRLMPNEDNRTMPNAVAGDSSIWILNRLTDGLDIITNSSNKLTNGSTDASGFIGSKRYKGPGRIGTLILPEAATVGLFTDGIDHWRTDCGYTVAEVLASTEPPEAKAEALINGTNGADDVAAIVIDLYRK